MSDYGSAIEGVNWLAIFIQSLSVLFLAPAFFTALYYILLAVYALISKPEVVPYEGSSFNSFAIVIPAHNEEGTIMGVLKSCAELDYPGEKYEVYVIADNCSDRTVEIVKEEVISEKEIVPEEIVEEIVEEIPEEKTTQVIINQGISRLNVRKGPGSEYDIVTKVYPGESYPLLQEDGEWYKIKVRSEEHTSELQSH